MSRYSFVALLLFCVAFSGYSREGIEWLSTSYDFGTFKEAEGPQTGCVRMRPEIDADNHLRRVIDAGGASAPFHHHGYL